jgi:membrane protein YqaA with SNARE-associated domain
MSRFGSPIDLLRRISHARYGLMVLFWVSALEGAVLPVPMEAVIAPYMQMRRDMLWRIAFVTLAGFLLVAVAGYAIGALFFDALGQPLLDAFTWQEAYDDAQAFLQDHGFWALVLIAVTPIPVQLGMIGAGALGYPLVPYVLAMVVGRGGRYFGTALLVQIFGDQVVRLFARRAGRPAKTADQPPGPPR